MVAPVISPLLWSWDLRLDKGSIRIHLSLRDDIDWGNLRLSRGVNRMAGVARGLEADVLSARLSV